LGELDSDSGMEPLRERKKRERCRKREWEGILGGKKGRGAYKQSRKKEDLRRKRKVIW